MDTTIRNLDEDAYRALKAHAAVSGRTIGAVVSDAIRAYLSRAGQTVPRASLADLEPEDYARGSERLSEELDSVLYGD